MSDHDSSYDDVERKSPWPRILAAISVVVVLLVIAGIVHLVRGRLAEVKEALAGKGVVLVTFATDSSQRYLADGIAHDLDVFAMAIPEIHMVRVDAPDEKATTAQAIGRAWKAQYVIDGTLRRSASRLRVTMRLTSVGDGRELWSGAVEAGAADVGQVEDSLADDMATALREQLQVTIADGSVIHRGTQSDQAYDLYLRGRYLMANGTPENARKAEEPYRQSVARDTMFGKAYGALATAQVLSVQESVKPDVAVLNQALEIARRGARLDQRNSDAFAVLGRLSYLRARWRESENLGRHAVELDSSSLRALGWHVDALIQTGALDDALEEVDWAQKLDSNSAAFAGRRAEILFRIRTSAAQQEGLQTTGALDTVSGTPYKNYATASAAFHNRTEVLKAFRRVVALDPSYPDARGRLVFALAAEQQRAEAEELDAKIQKDADTHRTGAFEAALSRLGLGDATGAVRWLERSVDANEPETAPLLMACDPFLAKLGQDVRFSALLRKRGMRGCPRSG